MKQLSLLFLIALCFSSCLKQSIADAMIDNEKYGSGAPRTATMSYLINGNKVSTTVDDPDKQSPTYYQLGCTKTQYPGSTVATYSIDFLSSTGDIGIVFSTDSMKVGNYAYFGEGAELFVGDYNNTAELVYYSGDSISFNITAYKKGHISGTFSGKLTPLASSGSFGDTYGTPGSVLVTEGNFKDVPVFY